MQGYCGSNVLRSVLFKLIRRCILLLRCCLVSLTCWWQLRRTASNTVQLKKWSSNLQVTESFIRTIWRCECCWRPLRPWDKLDGQRAVKLVTRTFYSFAGGFKSCCFFMLQAFLYPARLGLPGWLRASLPKMLCASPRRWTQLLAIFVVWLWFSWKNLDWSCCLVKWWVKRWLRFNVPSLLCLCRGVSDCFILSALLAQSAIWSGVLSIFGRLHGRYACRSSALDGRWHYADGRKSGTSRASGTSRTAGARRGKMQHLNHFEPTLYTLHAMPKIIFTWFCIVEM